MLRPGVAATVALLCSMLLATSPVLWAQNEPPFVGSVEVVHASAMKYRTMSASLIHSYPGYRTRIEAPAGKMFLAVHLDLRPIFAKGPDGKEECRADFTSIRVDLEGGESSILFGTCSPHGTFYDSPRNVSFYYSENPEPKGFDGVFLVSEKATQAKMTIGGTTHELTFPTEALERIDPAQAVAVDVKSSRIVDRVSQTVHLGYPVPKMIERPEELTTRSGRFLVVEFEFRPKVRNQQEGVNLGFTAFSLLIGDEIVLPPAGTFYEGRYSEVDVNWLFEADDAGVYNSKVVTVVFPLPSDAKSAKLLYLDAPVADLTFAD